jgi:hypothetical protein
VSERRARGIGERGRRDLRVVGSRRHRSATRKQQRERNDPRHESVGLRRAVHLSSEATGNDRKASFTRASRPRRTDCAIGARREKTSAPSYTCRRPRLTRRVRQRNARMPMRVDAHAIMRDRGEMAEWSKARDSKSRIPQGIQGSNPCLSAISMGVRTGEMGNGPHPGDLANRSDPRAPCQAPRYCHLGSCQ